MNMRKLSGLLLVIFCLQGGFAQNGSHDSIIGSAISDGDWFAVRACYEQEADSLSDFMRLFSGALLDHHFNNPAGAVEKIQQMYDRHGDKMGGNFFSLFWMMSDNLAKLRHFKSAENICTSLLSQGRNQMDEGTRTAFETNAVLFGARAQWPEMGVLDYPSDYSIPFELKEEQIRFTAVRNGKPIKTMLDSGGQMTVIDKQLAIDLGLKLTADSVAFNEVRCPLALLDTLQLGSATFVNIPCAVLSPREAGVTDCSIILGNDILQLFPEIEVDYELRDLNLKSRPASRPDQPRNLFLNKVPYVQVQLEGIPAVMMWDTGGTKSSIEPDFYDRYRDRLPPLQARGRKQAKTVTGNNPNLEYTVLPQVQVAVAGRTGVMRNPYVIMGLFHSDLMGIPFDGTWGVVPPEEFSRVTINFLDMYFIAE